MEESKLGLILNVLFEQWKYNHRDETDTEKIQLLNIDSRVLLPVRDGTGGSLSEPHIFYLTATLHFRSGVPIDLSVFRRKPTNEALDYMRDTLHSAIEDFRQYLSSIEEFASDGQEPLDAKVSRILADDTEQAAQRPEGLPPQE